jgi:hypothetical protein
MKRALLVLLLCAGFALPARASSVTIDSTNCNSSSGCYGLTWTLSVESGTFDTLLDTYEYKAVLEVTDDSLVAGTPSVVISAVDFKVSDSVSNAELISIPTSSSGGWTTYTNVLNSGGCTGANAGFVCSQSPSDPANFTASTTPQTWVWYFNTSDPLFADLYGAHIGAKMTSLSTSGRLLSATAVPEPGTLALLGAGLTMAAVRRRRARA